MMQKIFIHVVSILWAGYAYAAVPTLLSETQHYQKCRALAASDEHATLRYAQDWLLQHPESVSAHHCKAMAQVLAQSYDDATATLRTLHAMLPEDQEYARRDVQVQIAKTLRLAGHYTHAHQELSALITPLQATPNTQAALLEVLMERSRLAIITREPMRAMHDLDHILALEPHHLPALMQRARLYLMMQEYALAQHDVDVAQTQHPHDPQVEQLAQHLREYRKQPIAP
jgi:predicted Zn-dependent protease